jgi:hypothetical protein
MNNKLLTLVGVAFALLIAIAIALSIALQPRNESLSDTPQAVTIVTPISVQLFSDDDEHGTNTEAKAIDTIEGTKKVSLKPGTYRLLSSATDDYTESQQNFNVEAKSLTVTFTPEYSEKKLASLLAEERSAIIKAITRDTPRVPKFYTIQTGWLYGKGDWYATKLVYRGPSKTYDTDTLRLVARKQDNSWKVVTIPPQITVSRILYPEIPETVAKDINNFR